MRNGLLDCFRFAGAIGIVLFHLKMPGGTLGLSALSFFAFTMSYFAVVTKSKATFLENTEKLNRRLLWPWMFWSCAYLGAKLAKSFYLQVPYLSGFEEWMWWTGPAIHLWFLPFAFTICLLATQLLAPYRDRVQGFLLAAGAIVPICLSACYVSQLAPLGIPWTQYASVMPAVTAGVAFGMTDGSTTKMAAIAAIVVLACTLAIELIGGWLPIQFAIGSLSAIAIIPLNGYSNRLTNWLGSVALGIYLAHPLTGSISGLVVSQRNTWVHLLATLLMAVALAEIYRHIDGYFQHRMRLPRVVSAA